MKSLTLKHLRYFQALAVHRHFGRAADACAISQPALSLQIKDLETALGGPLVERSSRRVHLTALGEEIAERAQRILQDVDALGDLGRALGGVFQGRLRLGVIPTIAPYLLADVITALRSAFPGLEIEPREAMTGALLSELETAALDAAIVALPVSETGLLETPLFEEDFLLARPLAEAGAPTPPISALREMRLLLLAEGHCFRDQALALCELDPAGARHLMEGASLSTLVQMVGAGLGVTLVPEMATKIEGRIAPVAFARFPAPSPARRIGMIWRKSDPLAERLTEVAAVVRSAASSRGALGRPINLPERTADLPALDC